MILCTDGSNRSLELCKARDAPLLIFGAGGKKLAKEFRREVYFFLPQECETDGENLFFTYRTDCFELKFSKRISSVSDFSLLEMTSNLIPSFLWNKAVLAFDTQIRIFSNKTLWEFEK